MKYPVRLICRECANEWDGVAIEEQGTGWYEPREDCAKCGSMDIREEEREQAA